MSQLLDQIRTITGPEGVLTQGVNQRPTDGWGTRECMAPAIVRPATTGELSEIMKLCHKAGQKIVTQGGCTNMTRGCVAGTDELVISMERMNHIDAIDPVNRTMTVQSGVPLQRVQEHAETHGLFFALDLGARGTATIGGNIATNAGGNQVIRYGMTREQVLGLEVVLSDGRILSSMNQMLKNNAGYDLKHLFIGSEGTLGIVTRAVLRLRPHMPARVSGLVATDQFSKMAALLNHMEQCLGGKLSAFETMWHNYYDIACRGQNMGQPPLPDNYPFYILIEATGAHQASDTEQFLLALDTAMSEGLIVDAVLAESGQQQQAMWAIRDNIPALMAFQPIVLFDISLPISEMEGYLGDMQKNLRAISQDLFIAILGHLGDGNLHVAVQLNEGSLSGKTAVEHAVYAPLQSRGGSISGEHGIGLEKKNYLHFSRNKVEVEIMRQLKQLLDPTGILNCGKII